MEAGLITLATGVKWIERLFSALKRIRQERAEDLEAIADVMGVHPLEIVRFYVEPDCQDVNPADVPDDDLTVSRQAAMQKIETFVVTPRETDTPGTNHLFILSDAGMGKSTLLGMLKLLHIAAFLRHVEHVRACSLLKLNTETRERIHEIDRPASTLLLLDSIDEDPEAYGRAKERIVELLQLTRHFSRVILTCRTQFFPDTEPDPFGHHGRVVLGGFSCRVKYLAPFDRSKVETFLYKRFPRRFWVFPNRHRKRAEAIVSQMGSLSLRPMLLAHIRDLLERPIGDTTEYGIYHALVTNWLNREHAKGQGRERPAELFAACQAIATAMAQNRQRSLTLDAITQLAKSEPAVAAIPTLAVTGRSLLNKTSDGDFRFSHSTIGEFLVVNRWISSGVSRIPEEFPFSNFMARLLVSQSTGVGILTSSTLRGASLRGINLANAVLCGKELAHCDLSGASLRGSNCQDSSLSDASMRGADLTCADLSGSTACGVDFSGSKHLFANFLFAKLERSTGLPQSWTEALGPANVPEALAKITRGWLVELGEYSELRGPTAELLALGVDVIAKDGGESRLTAGSWPASPRPRVDEDLGRSVGVLFVSAILYRYGVSAPIGLPNGQSVEPLAGQYHRRFLAQLAFMAYPNGLQRRAAAAFLELCTDADYDARFAMFGLKRHARRFSPVVPEGPGSGRNPLMTGIVED